MLPETDIQKLASESRQKLIQEFAETYANLRERVKRVPDLDAKKVSEEFSCPLEVSMIAYLINMDGIMSLRDAVGLFATELARRALVHEDVPNLSGNVMEFALVEGRWISHLHGQFTRQMEIRVRSLANLEDVVDSMNLEVEKALMIIAERIKLAEAIISPIVEEWRKEHIKSTSVDVITSFGLALTKWNRSTLNGKFKQIQKRSQAYLRLLRQALTQDSDSFTIDASIERLDTLIAELEQPLEKLTPRAIAHFLLHLVPRAQSGRGDRSPFVDVGVRSTRGNKAEPDMSSPFDFLERDIKLGNRRKGDDKREFLLERIARVLRVLKYQGNDIPECVSKCYSEIIARFNLKDVNFEESLTRATDKIIETLVTERDAVAVVLIHDFVNDHVYSEDTNS
ncbi:MAG: hypothetical protein E4H14_07995 [Candidatus Thorarchaeota archaeon]|nr:MAG: hypothetical protein E4H14_07995 [Candidatus Thorarchaeota archaeon]